MADETLAPLKRCTKCGESKPAATEFPKQKHRADGLSSWCRWCHKVYAAIRNRRPDVLKANCEREKARYWRDADASRARRREYLASYRSQPGVREKERAAEAQRYWRDPEAARAAGRARHAKRRQSQKVKLDDRVRTRMRLALMAAGAKKGGRRWRSVTGYSLEELARHIEAQFLKGMSWQNMGEWEIDHILPLASFAYEDMEDHEFKAAWSLSNLRPLWAKDNRMKSDRRLYLV